MATFVLVHGAMHGGWCWSRTAIVLQKRGHAVFAPTLTGLGERAHLLNRGVGLHTHVEDVANVVHYEDLRDVVLVGHSYGGMVISGAAERVPDCIAHLAYLDAYYPPGSESLLDLMGERQREFILKVAAEHGDGWLFTLTPDLTAERILNGWGVTDPQDIAWMAERLTPHPVGTFEDHLAAVSTSRATIPRTFIHCTESYAGAHLRALAEAAGGFRFETIAAGHDAMVTSPDALAQLLHCIAG
jgi:pimeloyl-ACP methyl ester carboxylesterase